MATIFQKKLQEQQQNGLLSRIGSLSDRDKQTAGIQLIPPRISQGVGNIASGLNQAFQRQQEIGSQTLLGGRGIKEGLTRLSLPDQLAKGNIKTGFRPLDTLSSLQGGAVESIVNNGLLADVNRLAQQPDYQEFLRGQRQITDLTPETQQLQINPVLGTILDVGETPRAAGRAAKPVIKSLRDIIPEAPIRNIDEVIPRQSFSSAADEAVDMSSLLKRPKSSAQGIQKSGVKRTYDAVIKPSKNVIAQSGPSGNRVVELLDKSKLEGELSAGNQSVLLNEVFKPLSKQEKATFADVVEGRLAPSSPAQEEALNVWRGIAADIHTRAKEAGLDIGFLENYFPRHIIKDGSPEIKKMLSRAGERRYGNLELSRQTDAAYDKDPSVLFDYIERANQRIADATNFGNDDRILYNLINRVADEGGDAVQARTYLDQILGKNQNKTNQDISRAARSIQSLKLNPASSLTNLTQNLSTALATDPVTMTRTIGNVITNPEQAVRNAIAVGEISPTEATRVLSDLGDTNLTRKWLRAVGFTGAEKINRVIAVNAGIEHSNKLIRQAKEGSQSAVRELQRLGFDVSNLDKIDPFLGGKKLSEMTQFSTDVGELPYGWQTPIGRILTQFKSFAYKQTDFLWGQGKRVYQEFIKGNVKPLANALATYGIAAPIVGEIILDAKSIFTNRERDEKGFDRYMSNILGAMSFGLLDSLPALTGKYGEKGILSTLGGPTVGDILKAGETVQGVARGDDYEKTRAARNVVSSIPGVGRTIANTLVPNSYVDNIDIAGVNLGVNEGLGGQDLQTFRDIKASDPQAANEFRRQAQQERKERRKQGGSVFDIFKREDTSLTIPQKGASEDSIKDFNKRVDKVMDQGIVPEAGVIKQRFFDNKQGGAKDLKERSDVFKELDKAMSDEFYSDEQKMAILQASGVDPVDYEYYSQASKDADVKLQELLPKFDAMNDEELLQTLMIGRREIADKQLITSQMIDYLYEKDYISKDQRDMVKALQYDQIKDEFYFKKSFKSKSGGKVSYSKAKSLFNIKLPPISSLKSVDNLLRIYQPDTSQNKAGERILEDILRA